MDTSSIFQAIRNFFGSINFENAVDIMVSLGPFTNYSILFGVLILCGFGLPLPEDIVLIIGGYLSYFDFLNVHIMVLVGLAGVLLGDSIMFFLGRRYGPALLNHRYLSRIVTPDKIKRAQININKYGNRIFFIARFLPGLRSPIFFTGGTLKTRFYIFFAYDGIAALLSVPLWVYSAYYGGEYIYRVIQIGKNAQVFILGLILLIVGVQIFLYYRNVKAKQREQQNRHSLKKENEHGRSNEREEEQKPAITSK
ncbi:MAG: DedA family protein [Oligoflexia bacterium]|nr:DedA family protein [Oligoflexia bacterium]MBF0364542.1 DedA family protein [Oligoflexia bacterium]